MVPRIWLFLKREPLLQFAALGTAVFLLHAWWSPDRETIAITADAVRALARDRAELLGRPMTEEEHRRLIEELIEQEVLVREAYRRGLDRSDGRIRHQLVDKMRFLLDEDLPEPTRRELEAFYLEHRERYRLSARLSFDHVFYPKGSASQPEAGLLLSELRAGSDFRKRGEPFWLGSTLERYSELELARILGAEFARAALELPVGEWRGPLHSRRGSHFVRLKEKYPPNLRPFEDLVPALREDWLMSRRQEILSRKVAELRKLYRIEVLSEP